MFHIRSLNGQFILFFFQVHPADVADGNDGTDDADNTKRVSASISQCDRIARVVQLIQSFLCGTQPRSIGNSTVENTYHHGKIDSTVNEIDTQSYCYIQYHNAYCKHV